MPWTKIDDQFYDHPKTVAAGPEGIALFVCGLSYCARQLTDGFIVNRQVSRLIDCDDPLGVAQHLVNVGLWEHRDGGYQVHDYLDYNPSRKRVLAMREAKTEAGRKGGVASGEARAKHKSKQVLEQKPSRSEAQGQARGVQPKTNSHSHPQSHSHTQDPEEKSSPAKNAGTRKPSEYHVAIKELEDWFEEHTKLTKPKRSTKNQKAAASRSWWQPLWELYQDECGKDMVLTQRLIASAVERMTHAEKPLTIASPRSVLKVAKSIKAEWDRGYQPGLPASIRAVQEYIEEVESNV